MPNVSQLWLDTFEVSGLVPTGLTDVEELANVAFYAKRRIIAIEVNLEGFIAFLGEVVDLID
jgi:hypothetical protein